MSSDGGTRGANRGHRLQLAGRLALHVALLGFDFAVHEPAELVERFRALHARMGHAIQAPWPRRM